MKRLVVIVGPNAVGKTTTAKCLVDKLPKTAYVDSDWCRFMNPFQFTEITKQTVAKNMYDILRNYLICKEIENVIFTYSWHGERKEIYDNLIIQLKSDEIEFEEKIVVLKCSEEENISRAEKDVRDRTRIERGIKNTFYFYDVYYYPSIDSTNMSTNEVVEQIIELIL